MNNAKTKNVHTHYLTLYQDALVVMEDGKCVSDISREVVGTFSYMCLIISDMKAKKILVSTKKGRRTILKLTDKGKNLKKLLTEYKKALSCPV